MIIDESNAQTASEEKRIRSAYALRNDSSLYSCLNPGHLFRIQQLERCVLTLLRAEGFTALNDKKILEIGCGQGNWLREFIKWGASPSKMAGLDLLVERIEKAKQLCPQGIDLRCGNASKLPFQDESFDIITQFTVFSSILDVEMKKAVSSEILRVLKAEGCVFWYDFCFNNPRSSDTRGIRKLEISQLFPDCRIELRKVTLIPPLTRVLAPWSWLGCYALEYLQIFNTHYLGIIRKKVGPRLPYR
jgi:SAM-dependent methyltransferase